MRITESKVLAIEKKNVNAGRYRKSCLFSSAWLAVCATFQVAIHERDVSLLKPFDPMLNRADKCGRPQETPPRINLTHSLSTHQCPGSMSILAPVTLPLCLEALFPVNLSWFLVIVSFLPEKPFPQ